eukprot:Nitzschia sp. Nitz4//scaffold110_size71422//44600//46348//NITZ4_005877-RA/size71422-processed-gene-0.72-mRNA-1//-1//CDS//3329533098//2252//frame0
MAGEKDDPTSKPEADSVTPRSSRKRMSRKERKDAKRKRSSSVSSNPDPAATAETSESEPDLLAKYEAIPVPTQVSREVMESSNQTNKSSKGGDDDEGGQAPAGSLGKWFPNALLVKCPWNYSNTGKLLITKPGTKEEDVRVDNPRSSLVLFYQYTHAATGKEWAPMHVKLLMTYLSTVGNRRYLGGRVRVSTEGVNATVSAIDSPQCSAKEALRHFAQDLKNFDPKVFAETDFKYIDDLSADRHFKELKIIPVQELVFYDIRESDAPLKAAHAEVQEGSVEMGGVHLEAKDYHEMLKKKDAVVIDVRNHYEAIIGRFDGQVNNGGATYIDPKMRKSTDFKGWLDQDDTKEKLKDKTVLMFCTGGIRCERASVYLKNKFGQDVNGVYQLKGGIERYLKAYPEDGGFWTGKNKVFDKRESVSAINPNGDGGVVKKAKIGGKEYVPTSKCCVCGVPWDRYVGKKKCWTCGVPLLMCDKCMSKAPDRDPKLQLNTRCTLCIEENITVPADQVEFTENGIKNKDKSTSQTSQAASVLKWGGGHAAQKKLHRKMKRRVCKYGADCNRPDCLFVHPEPGSESDKKVKTV